MTDYEGFDFTRLTLVDWVPVANFYVVGRPAPQGSKSGFVNKKTGRVQMVEKSTYVKPWRAAIVAQTPDHARKKWADAVRVSVDFYVERGKTVTRRYPIIDPDLDKFVRSTFDGLTEAGVVDDDCVIIAGSFGKYYAPPGLEPGAHIRIDVERWGNDE